MARNLDCSCPQWGLHRPGCSTGLGVVIAENIKALKALEDAKKAASGQNKPAEPWDGGYWVVPHPGIFKALDDISQQDTKELPALEIVELCSAKPPCGLPDEECGQCRAKNCPGVKCWRGCGR